MREGHPRPREGPHMPRFFYLSLDWHGFSGMFASGGS